MERHTIDSIIQGSKILHLGLSRDNKPYIVPLSFGYDGEFFYVHSGQKGMKIEHIESNPNVCFELENEVKLASNESNPCNFNFLYKSVIGFGEISEITEIKEKNTALKILMSHYSDKEWGFPDNMMKAVRVWKIEIQSITGKHSS